MTWNPVDIAWVAGIVEGEGWISVAANTSVAVGVKMTDEDVVRRLQTLTGIGSVFGPYQPKDGRKPNWIWRVQHRRDVARLLLAIAPLMGSRRKEQIDKTTARLAASRGAPSQRTHCPYGHAYVDGNIYRTAKGRWCRICKREAHKRWLSRKAAA